MMTNILPNITLVMLVATLCEYLRYLYCGCWFSAGAWFVACATNCWSLWKFEQQRQLQRALDEVDRIRRQCLAFMLQLPGQIYLTAEIEGSGWT